MTDRHKPPEKWTMRFCPGCGQDDLQRDFKDKHYSFGKLCGGVPAVVTYVQEGVAVAEALERAAQVADRQAEKYSEDGHFGWHRRDEAQDIAAAIRALKPEK